MSVASKEAKAHLAAMLDAKDQPVTALAPPAADSGPERAPVLLARPMQGEPDWRKMAEETRRRFPKVLARLAE